MATVTLDGGLQSPATSGESLQNQPQKRKNLYTQVAEKALAFTGTAVSLATSSLRPTASRESQQNHSEKPKNLCTYFKEKALAVASFAGKKEKAARLRAGSAIRDAFFFPLHASPKIFREQSEAADKRYKDFWDPQKKPNSIYARHREIRNHFTPLQKKMALELGGKPIELSYLVIEPKHPDPTRPFYHCGLMPGNLSTIYDMASIHPYLYEYLKQLKTNKDLPQGRFVIISLYGLKEYKPENLNDAGSIVYQAFDHLYKTYDGPLNLVIFDSLGTILGSSALPLFDIDLQKLPRHICFERGPSSIDQASGKYWHWPITLLLAHWSGWRMNTGKQIAERAAKYKEEGISIYVTGVKHDHHFTGKRGLPMSPEIIDQRKQKNVKLACFDADPAIHQMSHHSLSPIFLNEGYIVKEEPSKEHSKASSETPKPKPINDFLEDGETLSGALTRLSIDPKETKQK